LRCRSSGPGRHSAASGVPSSGSRRFSACGWRSTSVSSPEICWRLPRGVRVVRRSPRSAPTGRPTGFDVGGVAEQEILRSRVDRIFPYDYPVLFWLRPLLVPGAVVFDYGGHVGVHFYAYGRVLEFPPGLTWTVCELPAVVEAGRTLAVEREAPSLRFTGSTAEASGADVLIASGVLQYVESPPLGELLAGLAEPPRHVFVNKLPLTDGEPFITLQHGGVHFPAVRVCNRDAFIDSIRAEASSWWMPGRTTSTG
jgi:putative methyltransferase (TIGR04325 family)